MPIQLRSKPAVKESRGVMGLDVSTKTGIILLYGKYVSVAHETAFDEKKGLTPLRRLARASALRKIIAEQLRTKTPWLVVIEGYSHASKFNNSMLAELGCVVRMAVFDAGIRMLEVPPSMLKKFAAGNGTAKKDQVRLGTYKKWGFEHDSDNVVDAYVLARIGQAVLDGGKTAYEKEIVAKLKAQWG